MNRFKLLWLWNVGSGLMDGLTGLLLVLAPRWVCDLLGIEIEVANEIYLSWIGVFVGAVGLSYFLGAWNRSWMSPVWMFTGLVRILVALFLVTQISKGALVDRWLIVAYADGFVALFQFCVLGYYWRKGGL